MVMMKRGAYLLKKVKLSNRPRQKEELWGAAAGHPARVARQYVGAAEEKLFAGKIELDPAEPVIVVNYATVLKRRAEEVKRTPGSQRIKLKTFGASSDVDKMANLIVSKCKYIHSSSSTTCAACWPSRPGFVGQRRWLTGRKARGRPRSVATVGGAWTENAVQLRVGGGDRGRLRRAVASRFGRLSVHSNP